MQLVRGPSHVAERTSGLIYMYDGFLPPAIMDT